MKTHFFTSTLYKALFISILALISISCNKTTENIGDGLLPEGDHIGACFTDTLQITCHSEIIDSMATKGMNTVLLGSMMDPVMGRTEANLFTQLHLSSSNHSFGSNPVIDSVVLQFDISGFYGDTTAMQTVHVYQLTDSLSSTENYYQFSDVAVNTLDLANGYQFHPHPRTNQTITGTDTITRPVIRIPLSVSFGEMLASADSTVYSTPVAFKEFFYGLKISCEPVSQGGAICYLSPTSNNITQLQIYYRETPGGNPMRYYFYITSEETYFNQYLHDYSLGSSEFVNQTMQGDTTLGQQQVYLQSLGGVRTVLRFPNLCQWTNSLGENQHIIINEAKLILPASSALGDSTIFTAPNSLALLNINKDGSTSLLQDYYEGNSYYGGSYSHPKRSVTFRIAEHIQRIILGQIESQGMYLSITGASFNAQRWIIAGPESADESKLRCEIKYSIVGE